MPLYSIKLYIGITASMSLALSICVLFISLMQPVNGAQFLNTTTLSALFGFSSACGATCGFTYKYICITIIT